MKQEQTTTFEFFNKTTRTIDYVDNPEPKIILMILTILNCFTSLQFSITFLQLPYYMLLTCPQFTFDCPMTCSQPANDLCTTCP